MNELWANFLGYLSLYKGHMVPILVLGIFLMSIVWTLMKNAVQIIQKIHSEL